MKLGRVVGWTVIAGLVLSMSACIIAVKSEESTGPTYDGNSTSKVKLSSAERKSLPAVSTTADLPTVRSRYADELGKLGPSTTLSQFKAMFPGAKFVERRESGGSKFDAYAVRVEEKLRYRDESYGYMARDEKWFYFKDEVFVKWSGPNEWPEGMKQPA